LQRYYWSNELEMTIDEAAPPDLGKAGPLESKPLEQEFESTTLCKRSEGLILGKALKAQKDAEDESVASSQRKRGEVETFEVEKVKHEISETERNRSSLVEEIFSEFTVSADDIKEPANDIFENIIL
ncbi:hypothetical protein ACJX0J_039893, partial [Zea mays]